MRRKLVDRILTVLSGISSKKAGIPLALALAVLPAVYMSASRAGPSTDRQILQVSSPSLVNEESREEFLVEDDPARTRF